MSHIGGRSSRARCLELVLRLRHFPTAHILNAQKKLKPAMNGKQIHSVGIIMNGVTGRMGLNQHLRRSIYALIQQGGLSISDEEAIMPRPLLVGRNAYKLEAI